VNKRIYAYVSCMNCIKHISRVAYDFNPNSKIGYIKWILGQVEKRVTSFVCFFGSTSFVFNQSTLKKIDFRRLPFLFTDRVMDHPLKIFFRGAM